MKTKKMLSLVMVFVLFFGVFACKGASKSEDVQKKYRIALSNSYMGNDWRQIMTRVAELVAASDVYKDKCELVIVNTENTPEAQSESIDVLVSQGYDAILLDPSSVTALNPVVERAINDGVLVVAFDQGISSDAPYKIQPDFRRRARLSAEYVVKSLNGKGNVIVDRGLPGSSMSQEEYNIAIEVFGNAPGIKVVAEYASEYAQGPSQIGVASALTADSRIDAVWTQGPMTGVVNAFLEADRKVPLITGGGYGVYNGDALTMLDGKYDGLVWLCGMPGQSVVALDMAIRILDGETVEKNNTVDDLYFASNNPNIDIGVPIDLIEEGKNCWRDRDSSFGWPVVPVNFPVQLSIDEVYAKR
jgi:ribose transport system substrate-binding protein